MSRITKNKKRIDPRYFLYETTGIYKSIDDISDIEEAKELYNSLMSMAQDPDPRNSEFASNKLNALISKFPELKGEQ